MGVICVPIFVFIFWSSVASVVCGVWVWGGREGSAGAEKGTKNNQKMDQMTPPSPTPLRGGQNGGHFCAHFYDYFWSSVASGVCGVWVGGGWDGRA